MNWQTMAINTHAEQVSMNPNGQALDDNLIANFANELDQPPTYESIYHPMLQNKKNIRLDSLESDVWYNNINDLILLLFTILQYYLSIAQLILLIYKITLDQNTQCIEYIYFHVIFDFILIPLYVAKKLYLTDTFLKKVILVIMYVYKMSILCFIVFALKYQSMY